MFQFPGFASYHYGFMIRYPCGWVAPFGYPRINACSRLPMAFRSVPRPSSPPGAKASTECPSYTRYPGLPSEGGSLTMHRNHPQSQSSGFRRQKQPTPRTYRLLENSPGNTCVFRTQQDPAQSVPAACSRKPAKPLIKQDRSHASEPSPPTVGALLSRTAIPGQTIRSDDGAVVSGQSSAVSQKTAPGEATKPPIHAPRDAPEPDLHFQRTKRPPQRPWSSEATAQTAGPRPGHYAQPQIEPNSDIPRYLETVTGLQSSVFRTNLSDNWKLATDDCFWRRSGSNRRPPACKAGALPAELRPLEQSPVFSRQFTEQSYLTTDA
jgi:hypothetical protein